MQQEENWDTAETQRNVVKAIENVDIEQPLHSGGPTLGFVTVCNNTLWKHIRILGVRNYRAAKKPFTRVANLEKLIPCATEHFSCSRY